MILWLQLQRLQLSLAADQLTGTFNVQSQGDTTANEGDETFTVTISNPTNEAQIANDTATVTIKSDEIPVLSIADGVDITEANPSDGVVNAVFTITSTQLPSTPNNALTVHYSQAGGSFLDSSTPSPTSKSIEFAVIGGGVISGTLEIPIVNDTDPEANGAINVVLIEEQSGPGNTYSVDPASDTAKVDVRDDDAPKPVLSIAGPADSITEGVDENGDDNVAKFIVTAKDSSGTALNPLSPITILYRVTDALGDFLDASDEGDQSTATPITFTSDGNGNYTYTISIPIGDDNVKQNDGDITVALRASSASYDLDSDINKQSATASIVNDDLHVASFTATAFAGVEGETIRIVVEMDTPVTKSTKVYYEILNTGTAVTGTDYIQPSLGYVQFVRNTYLPTSPRYATFTGDRRQVLKIETTEDTGSTENKTINLRLTRTEGSAIIGASNISATATIIDSGAVPTLTIAPKSAGVENRDSAMFTITAVGGSVDGKTLKVRYTPAEVGSGSFLSNTRSSN